MKIIEYTQKAEDVLNEYIKENNYSEVFFLTDDNSYKFCFKEVNWHASSKNIIVVTPGEENKNLTTIEYIWNQFVDKKVRRHSLIVNLGGGVITDMGGFAASCYKRGVAYINIPTTLLSQVDASVGGKTGFDFNGFKNEIGLFSNSKLVIIDNRFLRTLPYEELLSGYAEMLKHSLLAEKKILLDTMKIDLKHLDTKDFLKKIEKSVQIKTSIVESDPFECGIRKSLNLGHTVGHALESYALLKDTKIPHGHAVAYGIVVALQLSLNKMGLDKNFNNTVKDFILDLYPKLNLKFDGDSLYDIMLHDKKNGDNGVSFTLLKECGYFEINVICLKAEILKAIHDSLDCLK